MSTEQSLLVYFLDAGPVVKAVMVLLLAGSIASWSIIFQRALLLKRAWKSLAEFEDLFWAGKDLGKLYTQINAHSGEVTGIAGIFQAGFREFTRLKKQPQAQTSTALEAAARAMRITCSREIDKLENHLSFLATVGSISPYIGLFGTVWGIMTSFRALASDAVQQATIAMVAPGISEALIATAMGLFAAIPAVIAYNRFANQVERLQNYYMTFQEEFSSVLYRQAHAQTGVMA